MRVTARESPDCSSLARTERPANFDLAIGNPPFSDCTARSDRAYQSLGLGLHDYFIVRSIDLPKPGALAAFVNLHGTLRNPTTWRANTSPYRSIS